MKNLEMLFAARFLLAQAVPFVGDDDVDNENDGDGGNNDANKGGDGNGGNNTPPPGKDKSKSKVQLSAEQQTYVNSLLAEERRKGKAQNDKTIMQLETLRNNVNTTAAEKEALSAQIEDLKNSHLTEKELADKQRKKDDKKKDDEIAAAKAEAERWRGLFNSTTVNRSIVDASLVEGHKANNPQHIVAILAPNTRLVEEVGEDGKPTGEYTAKTKVRTTKDGKPTTLEMTVTEAVKFMSEQDEHAGLFDSGASGGLGANSNRPNRKGGSGDPNQPPEDPAEYREWRKKNKKALGA